MYIIINPVSVAPDAREEEQIQHFLAIKQRITQQFPGNGKMFSVTEPVDDTELLYIDQWGFLDSTQKAWLDASPDITSWSWERGGTFVLAGRTPTVASYPCRFDYQDETREAHLDLTHHLGASLRLQDRSIHGKPTTTKPLSDEGLHVLLRHVGLPLERWTQTVWFCERCNQPGATENDFLCPTCELAQKRFMQEPQLPVQKPTSHLIVGMVLSILLLHSVVRGWRSKKTP